MISEEYKTQIFKTPEQWGSGLLYRLDAQENGGITLYSTPAFAQWIIKAKSGINNPFGLVVDKCGQVYLLDSDIKSKICKLYSYDCGTHNLEQLSFIINRSPSPEDVQCPQRMLFAKYTLWINDVMNKRVLAFSREDYQIKNSIDKLNDERIEPVDIGLDECGYLYVLIKKSNGYIIVKYDEYGNLTNEFELDLGEAVGLASGEKNVLYVLDRRKKQLLKYIENDSQLVVDPNFTIDLSKDKMSDVQRSGIVVAGEGNVFLSDRIEGLIHQFDPDGNSLGIVQGFKGTIQGLAVDSEGNIYVSSNEGICKLDARDTFTKEIGTYYSKTLDSGIKGCQWHRIALLADMPPKTAVEVSYSSSDDDDLKKEIDAKIGDKTISKQEKAEYLDKLLIWSGVEKNPKYMLFRGQQGRYLWLKIKLSTFDAKVTPAITQMNIYYPRSSFLRYLPAIYQEDPIYKEFLERFLSIFETAFDDLETKISHIYKYFDPGTVPQNFLDWLASWLNIALEEDWEEEKKRLFIQEAYSLYKQKGTSAGIESLVALYTGKKPVLIEYSKVGKPMILGENGTFMLGINSMLLETPLSGLRLGDECFLGKIALQNTVRSPEDPFLHMAHRFTVMLDLSEAERIRYREQLIKILDREKPAHTSYNLSFSSGMVQTGTYVGVTKLDYCEPLLLGSETTVGSAVVIANRERGGRVERSSIVGVGTELI